MELHFCQLSIGHLSRNRFWGESEDKPHRAALCSSSLLWYGEAVLLIDPCLPFEQMNELIFNRSGRRASEVTALFFTHPHGDHIVDAPKYAGAALYAGADESGLYAEEWSSSPLAGRLRPFPGGLLPGVEAVKLPGHTPGTTGLSFTFCGRRAVIAGDAVMTRDFFDAEAGYFNTIDHAAAGDTIRKIKSGFDIVVPGHDILFTV